MSKPYPGSQWDSPFPSPFVQCQWHHVRQLDEDLSNHPTKGFGMNSHPG